MIDEALRKGQPFLLYTCLRAFILPPDDPSTASSLRKNGLEYLVDLPLGIRANHRLATDPEPGPDGYRRIFNPLRQLF